MRDGLTLWGFGPSVYTRVVRIVLAELRLDYAYREVDPFADPGSSPHPMGCVPVLQVGSERVLETSAIIRCLDRRGGGRLTPASPQAAAQMDQVIAIADAYGYWPLVRQVYAHAVVRPAHGVPGDAAEVAAGLVSARPVLTMLEWLAAAGRVLSDQRSLADCHLAPMVAAFAMAPEGRAILAEYSALSRWYDGLSDWEAFRATDNLVRVSAEPS